MTFNAYWRDARFRCKRPNLRGSAKHAFGDNVYFRDEQGSWHQQDSHHSHRDGSPNPYNIRHDTKVNRVLIGSDYAYWGGSGPEIPKQFRDYGGVDICAGHGHKSRFSRELVDEFVAWFSSLNVEGYRGDPLEWKHVQWTGFRHA